MFSRLYVLIKESFTIFNIEGIYLEDDIHNRVNYLHNLNPFNKYFIRGPFIIYTNFKYNINPNLITNKNVINNQNTSQINNHNLFNYQNNIPLNNPNNIFYYPNNTLIKNQNTNQIQDIPDLMDLD